MRRLIRIPLLVLLCLSATGFAAWAATGAGHQSSKKKYCARFDADDQAYCMPYGPQGKQGPNGLQGVVGQQGAVGPVGVAGVVGAVGAQGAQGVQGIRGVVGQTGPTGADGAFVSPSGSDPGGKYPGGHTEIVLGSKIGPIPFPTGSGRGTELTPSVAECPTDPAHREAYDGGATIITTNPNNTKTPVPPTGDVVGLESSYTGLYAGPTEVDPLPLGAVPGEVSSQSANAYEAQAVITKMNSNDNVTVQSYVVCGP